jgi:CRP/FNR family transcriptional regulator, anaerobic regulatory protein
MKVITDAFKKLTLYTQIVKISKFHTYKKGAIILQEGETNDRAYYIISGLTRSYYWIADADESRELTSWFFGEGDLMTIPSSYVFGQPSPEAIEALENCYVMETKKQDLEALYLKYPELNQQARLISEKAMAMMDERLRNMVGLTAEQRYLAFQKQFAGIENRVPQKYIASFLGIDPSTLSRIRAKRN